MRVFLLLCLLLFVFTACNKDYNKPVSVSDYIPESADIIIKANDVESLWSLLDKKPSILSNNDTLIKRVKQLAKKLHPIDELSLVINGETISFFTEYHKSLLEVDSSMTKNSATLKAELNWIALTTDTLYYKVYNGIFCGSNKASVLNKDTKRLKNDTLKKLFSTSKILKSASVLYKDSMPKVVLLSQNSELYSKFINYAMVDFELKSSSLQYNGVTIPKDSLNALNIFKNTLPQQLKLHTVIPKHAKSFQRIAYNDYSKLSFQLSNFNASQKHTLVNVLKYTNEVGCAEINNDSIIILGALDIDLLKSTLTLTNIEENFKDFNIYKNDQPNVFNNPLKPFISYKSSHYFFIIDNFIVFGSELNTLKTVITDILNKNTLDKSDSFQRVTAPMAEESSFFIFKNKSTLKQVDQTYNIAAVQFSYDTNFAHINGHFMDYKKPSKKNSVTEYFSLSLPEDILTVPQTVKNHITKAHDIVVQDINNTLYLISSSGTIIWKKKLDAKIIGNIAQIDTYKNGRLQLAFATEKRVYVIDRNGNDVGKFPIKFNDNITQPLSVFDYDKTKNYRLLVTQNNTLLMYDAKGDRVKGFKHKKTENPIGTQPKHFRILRKDYIVYGQGNTLEIINRQGKTRVPVSTKIRFSGNSIYLYQNKFTTTNTLGELVQVDTKGRVNRKPIGFLDKHSFVTTSKTLVGLWENKLKIKTNLIDLDYGNYSQPRIFYLNDKIYVTTTDMQANKVYLFDSQAKPIKNFPVFGTSSADLQKLDNDRPLELITQSDSKTITVYKLN